MAVRASVPPIVTLWSQRAAARLRLGADRLRTFAIGRPRLARAALVAAVPAAWLGLGAFAWFTFDVTHTLPGRAEVRTMGNMAQATVLYDVADRPVFTIFKEQR